MSANPRIGSAFRLIGFVFLVVAMVPLFRGEGVNAALLAPGIAFWIIGLVIGLNAKRNTPPVVIVFFTVMAGLASCSSAQPGVGTTASTMASDNRLVGTWELVSTRATRGDSTILDGGPPEFRSLKILNGTHYSVITRRGDQFLRAGAGAYTLSGDTYTERVDLASAARFTPGAVYTFRVRVDGDTWTIDGGSGETRLQEVWRRVR